MTPEQLMKPRYKVIAKYPGMRNGWDNTFKVGRILHEPNIGWAKNELGFDLSEYPYLFRKLEWWEERSESDMPGYVKDKDTGVVCKVVEYYGRDKEYWVPDQSHLPEEDQYPGDQYTLEFMLPSTATEYTQYLKSKQ